LRDSVRRTLLACTALAVTISSAAYAAPLSFRVVQELKLPDALAMAGDVRWASAGSLYIANGREGVSEVTLSGIVKSPPAVPGHNRSMTYQSGPIQSFHHAWFLATSADQLVTASPFRAFAWTPRQPREGGLLLQEPFATSIDIDVWRNRVALLGVRGDANGRWPTAGYTLWTADLSPSGAKVEPFLGGPAIPPLSYCQYLETGAVRFFPDGRLAVALGVEPGVKLFDADRRLVRTWPTDKLGYEDHCTLNKEQSIAFGTDVEGRADWLNRRQALDEMLALPEGPLLVIRKATPKGTEWRGVLLPFAGGAPVDIALPISSPSRLARVKADLRGDRVVFLIVEQPFLKEERSVPTRAVVARLQR
jgi:hypothetical protein